MMRSRLALVTLSSVCLAVIVTAVAHSASPKPTTRDAASRPDAAKTALVAEKLRAAQEAWDHAKQMHDQGLKEPGNELRCGWARRLMEAKREAATTPVDRVDALKEYVANMKDLEKEAAATGPYGGEFTALNATYLRAEAEQMLAQGEGH